MQNNYNYLTKNSLKITFWNASGVSNKIHELYNFVDSELIDIAFINESWLKPHLKIPPKPDFTLHRYDREDMDRGGLLILVKNSFKIEIVENVKTKVIECMKLKIFTRNGPLDFIIAYFAGINSPYVKKKSESNGNSSTESITKFFINDLTKITNTNSKIYIVGDFNSRHTDWNCLRANKTGKALQKFLEVNPNLCMKWSDNHTYLSHKANSNPSTIDLLLTNNPINVSPLTAHVRLSSDHLPVTFEVKLNHVEVNDINYKYRYDKANWKSFKRSIDDQIALENTANYLDSINASNLNKFDSFIDDFVLVLHNAREIAVPQSPNFYKPTSQIVLTPEILQLKNSRNNIRRRFRTYRDPVDRRNVRILDRIIQEKITLLRNNNFHKFLEDINKTDNRNRKLHKISKVMRNKNTNRIPTLEEHVNNNGITNTLNYYTDKEKADSIAKSFQKAHELTFNQTSSMDNIVQTKIDEMDFANIPENSVTLTSKENLTLILKNLKNRKAPGYDEVNNLQIKNLSKKGIEILTILFNKLYNLSYFPIKWKHAKVIPIPKPGKNHKNPDNYRPISLLSSIGKIYEKLISEKIWQEIDSINTQHNTKIIPNCQFGFRHDHSTSHQLSRIVNTVKAKRNNMESTGAILLDIEKAFDSIWHNGLIYKLIIFQFSHTLIKLIKNFLDNRTSNVFIKNSTSNVINIVAGVPQGSVISPILYSIFVSDLSIDNHTHIGMYADDTILYSSDIEAENILMNLESSFIKTRNYFITWKIKINENKTNAIYFTRRRAIKYVPQRDLCLDNNIIPWSNPIKYLGVWLDSRLTFKHHTENTINKINKIVKSLYSLLNKKSPLFTKNKLLLYKSVIMAIMFYASPSWDECAECYYKKLQIIQNKCLKLIHCKPIRFSTIEIHKLANMDMVKNYICKRKIKFKNKCEMSDNPLITELFDY